MQLVTGHTGTEHVKSAQAGAMHAGIVGTGTYVLGTGSKLAATMLNANTVSIADGDLMLQGRHCSIAHGETDELTVQNGTQAQKRNDLVVARYEMLGTEPRTESVALKVIKGTPSDGEPEDPEYEEGDIRAGDLVAEVPLYRIPLDGISVGDPVPLFDVLLPMAELQSDIDELRDSVSQGELVCVAGEMPHQPTTSNEGNGVYAQKAGRIVMLHIRGGSAWGPPIGANVTLCTLPKRFWPAKCVSAPYVVPSAAGYGTIGVAENGRIYGSASAGAASSYYTCSIAYLSAS